MILLGLVISGGSWAICLGPPLGILRRQKMENKRCEIWSQIIHHDFITRYKGSHSLAIDELTGVLRSRTDNPVV